MTHRRLLRDESDDGSSLLPLMDVLFSVLAGVMYCLTIAEFGGRIDVDLPGIASSTVRPPLENVEVGFDQDGQLFLDGRAIDRTELGDALREAIGEHRRPIVIRGDRKAPFEVSVALYQAAREAGASNVLVATREPR